MVNMKMTVIVLCRKSNNTTIHVSIYERKLHRSYRVRETGLHWISNHLSVHLKRI